MLIALDGENPWECFQDAGLAFRQHLVRSLRAAGVELVTLDEARETFSEMRLRFLTESRRVDTTKMREVLGVTPRYADAADGIAASLAEESDG